MTRHIEILLLSNDCVIVPELGGFVAHHIDARYEKEEGMFLPPLRTIGFNQHLTLNDSLLAQSYVDAYDISYPEAMTMIEDEVEKVKAAINNTGSFEFFDLGTLSTNNEGSLTFTPCESGILTPELYALGSFEMPTLAETEQKKSEERRENTMALRAENEADAPILSIGESDGHKTVNISVRALRNVAIAACIAAFCFLMVTPMNEMTMSTQPQESGMFTQLFQSSQNKAETEKAPVFQAKPAPAPAPVVTEKQEAPAETTKQKRSDYWSIVLCTHVTEEGAEKLVRQLQKEGFDKAIVSNNGRYIKVVYGNYDTAKEAYNELNELRSNKNFKSSWVMHIDE